MIAAVRRAVSSPWGVASGLFLLALIPRVMALGSYITHDEPFWVLNSIQCIHGLGLGRPWALFQSAHPGIPPLIGHGTLLWLYYTLTGQPDVIPTIAESGWEVVFPPHLYHLLPEMIAVAGWFTAVVSALSVAVAYLLIRRLGDLEFGVWDLGFEHLALFAGLFLALDPYFLSLSRVVGLDAALAGFMLLSLLSLLVYLTQPSRPLILLGVGVFAALAILTKVSAVFLIPFILLAFVMYHLLAGETRRSGLRSLGLILLLAGGSTLVLLLLWPTMLHNPGKMLQRLVSNVLAVLTIPHESAGYFLGQVTADPGWLYYWVVLVFRLTPLTLPLGLSAVVLMIADGVRRRWRADHSAMLLLLLYAVLFLVMLCLTAKKQERYILPAVLAIDVLAAWSLARFWSWLGSRSFPLARSWVAVALILAVSLWWFRLHPHYFAYQNPLVGGSPVANWVYITGWGEGNELAADYLNQRPNARELVTVASFDAGVGAYTPGVVLWLSPETLQLADYAVIYQGSIRHDPTTRNLAGEFDDRQPVHTVFLDGIPYVKVYALTPTGSPRRLLSWQVPDIQHRESVAVGENIFFRGYDGDLTTVAPGETLTPTLYWQCVIPLGVDYNVLARLVDARTGQVWGQWDSAPVGGRFPTNWWLPGLVIRDDVAVVVDPATPPGEYELWVGMYNRKNGKRLWVGEQDSGRDDIVLTTVRVSQ